MMVWKCMFYIFIAAHHVNDKFHWTNDNLEHINQKWEHPTYSQQYHIKTVICHYCYSFFSLCFALRCLLLCTFQFYRLNHTLPLSNFLPLHTETHSLVLVSFHAKVLLMRQIFAQFTAFRCKHAKTRLSKHKENTKTEKTTTIRRRKNELSYIYRRLKHVQMQNSSVPWCSRIVVSAFSSSARIPFGFGIINLCISIFQCVNSIYMIRRGKFKRSFENAFGTHAIPLPFHSLSLSAICKEQTTSNQIESGYRCVLHVVMNKNTKISANRWFVKTQLDWIECSESG